MLTNVSSLPALRMEDDRVELSSLSSFVSYVRHFFSYTIQDILFSSTFSVDFLLAPNVNGCFNGDYGGNTLYGLRRENHSRKR